MMRRLTCPSRSFARTVKWWTPTVVVLIRCPEASVHRTGRRERRRGHAPEKGARGNRDQPATGERGENVTSVAPSPGQVRVVTLGGLVATTRPWATTCVGR